MPSTRSAVPVMPIHRAPETTFLLILIGMGVVLAVLAVAWLWTREFRRTGALAPLLFLGVGLASLIQEPVFDNVALYWYPPHNRWALYSAFGRTIPAYVPVGYAWFFGGVSFVLFKLFRRHPTERTVWLLFAASVVIDSVATALMSWLHAAGFYGNQPFNFFDYPEWFACVDAGATIINAVVLLYLAPGLRGWRQAGLIVLPFITYSAINGVVDAPVALAMHSGWSTAAVWLMGSLSIALGCCVVYVCARLVPGAGDLRSLGHRVLEHADPLDLNADNLPGLQVATILMPDARRSPGEQ